VCKVTEVRQCLCLHMQAELYDVCGISELVDAALDGYNVTGEGVS
jgi:hypothetical protein